MLEFVGDEPGTGFPEKTNENEEKWPNKPVFQRTRYQE